MRTAARFAYETQCFRLVKRDPWTGTRFETGHFRDGSEQVATRFAYENTLLSAAETGQPPTRSLEYNIIRARAAWPPTLSAAKKPC